MSVSEQQNHTEIDEMLENSEAVSEETLSEETVEKVSEGTSEETKTSAEESKEETIQEESCESAEEGTETEEEAKAEEKAEAEDAEEADKDGKSKKGFKKKSKEDKKVEALQEKVTDLEDRVKRQMAEFENFRKRSEKEKAAMFETGAKSVIEKILPVVDNFERGLATIPEEEKGNAFAEGMQLIYKQLQTELENLGVTPIEAVGKEFDPNFHNAVMQMESEEYESGYVVQEMLKGYMYRDTVVRHSMVAVVP